MQTEIESSMIAMIKNRSIHSAQNIIFGILGKITALIGPMIIRIITLKSIGEAYLGLTGVFSSIFVMLQLTELGFGYAVTYKLFKPFAKGDVQTVNAYLYYLRNVYRIVGMAILLLGLSMVPFLPFIIREKLPESINMNAVYLILLINSVCSYFLYAYKNVILTVSQRQDIESKIASIVNLITYIIQISVLIFLRNYYVYLFMLPISTIIMNLLRNRMIHKLFPEYTAIGKITDTEQKIIKNKLIKLAGHRISGTVLLSADNIIISIFLGINMVAKYNNYYIVINAIFNILAVLDLGIRPSIGNSMATESKEKNFKDFRNLSFISIWIVGWMSITWFCLIQDFVILAYNSEFLFSIRTVLLMAIELFVWKSMDIIATYRDSVGAWEGDSLIPYISALFNIIINIFLVKIIGIDGIVLSTLLSLILFSIPFAIKVLLHDVFGQSAFVFIKYYIKHSLHIFIIGFITYVCCKLFFHKVTYFNFFLKILLCCFIPNISILITNRHNSELNFIKQHANIIFKFLKNRTVNKFH